MSPPLSPRRVRFVTPARQWEGTASSRPPAVSRCPRVLFPAPSSCLPRDPATSRHSSLVPFQSSFPVTVLSSFPSGFLRSSALFLRCSKHLLLIPVNAGLKKTALPASWSGPPSSSLLRLLCLMRSEGRDALHNLHSQIQQAPKLNPHRTQLAWGSCLSHGERISNHFLRARTYYYCMCRPCAVSSQYLAPCWHSLSIRY